MIQNPNSSGQGFDPDHTSAPFYKQIMSFGYSYSHSVPVQYEIPNREHMLVRTPVTHHCFSRAGHTVMVWTRPDVCEPSFRWSTSTRPGSGVHTTGTMGLERHLRYKAGRYPALRLKTDQYWLFELRTSDGNDGTIYDMIVEATTLETARERVGDALTALYPKSESDGSWGNFHPCDCSCDHEKRTPLCVGICEACSDGWECSHGGATVNGDDDTVRGYPTYAEARAAGSTFHSRVLVSSDGSVS